MVFASIGEHAEHCNFFASTSSDKKFALWAASNLESTTHKQRALVIFSVCSNPYMEILFFKIKQNILKRNMTDVDEEELEEEQDPCVGTTSSGRILKLPNRFYWKRGLLKALFLAIYS